MAGADKLQAIKLAPDHNINKSNAVGKYSSIIQIANDIWDRESSYADLSIYDELDSSQEKSLKLVDKHHREKMEWQEQQEKQEKQ